MRIFQLLSLVIVGRHFEKPTALNLQYLQEERKKISKILFCNLDSEMCVIFFFFFLMCVIFKKLLFFPL